MKVGVPKGLLYSKYHVFARTFFEEIGAELIVSPDTNREILDNGVKHCIDDACLPIKIYHGHVSWLCGKCDFLLMPRFMSLEKRKSICPMFCGLIEMVSGSVTGLPQLIDLPIYTLKEKALYKWAAKAGSLIGANKSSVDMAYEKAMSRQISYKDGFNDDGYDLKIALIGHTYNVHDTFINMNLKQKLNELGIGVMTAEYADDMDINNEINKLYKQPFWYFARQYYGAAVHLCKKKKVHGIVYISAFACGIDSVVIELISNAVGDFPMMVLKIDEHTGEAGFDTRIEAFADMLKRRGVVGRYSAASGKYVSCS